MSTTLYHPAVSNGHVLKIDRPLSYNHDARDGRVARNRILAALPPHEWQRIASRLRYGSLPTGLTLHEEGGAVKNVYFLDEGMVSLVLSSRTGMLVEVGVVGREGIVGMEAATDDVGMSRALVQIAALGWQMPAAEFSKAYKNSVALQKLVSGYLQFTAAQSAQAALCNRLHSIEQRLARWLLVVRDRIGADTFTITQEFLSQMLGVQRPGVTIAAGNLRTAGLIDYKRGRIVLLNVPGLEVAACECHPALHARFHQLIAG